MEETQHLMGQVAIKCGSTEDKFDFFTKAVHTIFVLCTGSTVTILVVRHKIEIRNVQEREVQGSATYFFRIS